MTEPRASDGFTLVEVLVALTILSISLAVLLDAMGTNLNRLGEGQAEATALSLTLSLLAEVGTELPLREGDSSGEFLNGFHWRLHAEPYGDSDDRQAWPVVALKVSASTLWDRGRRSVTLTVLKLARKENP